MPKTVFITQNRGSSQPANIKNDSKLVGMYGLYCLTHLIFWGAAAQALRVGVGDYRFSCDHLFFLHDNMYGRTPYINGVARTFEHLI